MEEIMITGIYRITNLINNKVYIGQSININKRTKEHFYKAELESGQDYNSPLHRAIRKYGEENFLVELLEECSVEDLDEREKYYIKINNSIIPNGYNISHGGQKVRTEVLYCKNCGVPISKDSVLHLCRKCYYLEQRKNIPQKEELQNKLFEQNGNFSKVALFYNVSDTAVRKWCKSYDLPFHSSDYKVIKEKRPIKIPVKQIDIETGEVIATFESATAAARALGHKKGSHITEVCQGKNKTAYGYRWEYAALV